MALELRDKRELLQGLFFLFLILFSFFLFSSVFDFSEVNSLNFSSILFLFGRTFGLVGIFFLGILILSGDTARFFDKIFGMDRIIKFQRKFAIITLLFVFSHPLFFILSDSSFLLYLIPFTGSIPLSLGTLAFYLFIVISISSYFYKKISYKAWQYLHVLTYVLFFFGAYHALNIGTSFSKLGIKYSLFVLIGLIIIGATYRTTYKLKNINNGFKVKSIEMLGSETFILKLENAYGIKIIPGQYVFLRLEGGKFHGRHPFTVSGVFENEIEFAIKIYGGFTRALSKLKKGNIIYADGPFGVFTNENPKKDLVFIAGGIGITPFICMIRDNQKSKNPGKIKLFYSVGNEDDRIFSKEIDSIKDSWFKKIYINSKRDGHLNSSMLEKNIDDFSKYTFYICGPEKMKESIRKILINRGVKRKDIIIESFFW